LTQHDSTLQPTTVNNDIDVATILALWHDDKQRKTVSDEEFSISTEKDRRTVQVHQNIFESILKLRIPLHSYAVRKYTLENEMKSAMI